MRAGLSRDGREVQEPEIEVLVQRDCLGGERVIEVRLPTPVSEAALASIEGGGDPVILRSAPRPFFRVDVPGAFLVSGIVGDTRVRYTVRLARRVEAREIAVGSARRLAQSS